MAVRLSPRVLLKISSTVEKADEMEETTIDHISRILNDHDYLKRPASGEEMSEKLLIVNDTTFTRQTQPVVRSNVQNTSGACSSHNRKIEKARELPNDGIQASDLCSLLDKFEQAIGNSPKILTPATSPGHSGNWSEPLSVKINSQVISADLTPPTTPPIQEQQQQKHIQNDCKSSAKQNIQKTTVKKTLMERTAANKCAKKVDDFRNISVKKKTKMSAQVVKNIAQKTGEIELAENVKIGNASTEGGHKPGKRKCGGTLPKTGSFRKKVKTEVEIKTLSTKPNKKVNKSSEKSSVELSETKTGECSKNENSSDVGYDIEGKCSSINKDMDEKMVESQNVAEKPVNHESSSSLHLPGEKMLMKVGDGKDDKICLTNKELSNDENCIDSYDVTEENVDNNYKEMEESKANCKNNNQLELIVDTGKTMNNNNLTNVEKTKANGYEDDNHKGNGKDIEENSNKQTQQYNDRDENRKRKHKSRSPPDESCSDEEDPRRSQHNYKSFRHSSDNGRSKEKYRRYSSRGYYAEEKKYDDHHRKKPGKKVRDIELERKVNFRLGRSNIRDGAKGERRVIYVGGLPYGTTRDELRERFRKFGPIEKVTVHLRVGERDNYGFVTFFEPEDARECIERGNSDPKEPRFDLCFGGRRQFCGGSYVDFDSTTSRIEELNEVYGKVCEDIPEEDDFDSLLRMCQKDLGR